MASRPGWPPGYWGYDAGSDDLMAWGPEQTPKSARSVPWTDGPDSSELDIKVFRIDYSEGHGQPRGGPFTGETGGFTLYDDHSLRSLTILGNWTFFDEAHARSGGGHVCADPNTEPA